MISRTSAKSSRTYQGFVTSRKPDDLEAFCAKTIEEIAEGEHEGQTAEAGAASGS